MCKIVLIAAVCGFLLDLVNFSSSQAFKEIRFELESQHKGYLCNISGKCLDTANTNTQVFVFHFVITSDIAIFRAPSPVRNLIPPIMDNVKSCKLSVIKEELLRQLPWLKFIQFSFNHISRIPANAFLQIPLLPTLELNENKTVNLKKNAFSSNYPSLLRVVCARNLLQHWDITWFTNTTNLEIIDFNLNKITALPAKAFYNLKKLKEIRLNYNEINIIHADAFKGLKKLKYLGLGYNRLDVLEARAFPNALVVQELSLHRNYLNFLSTSLMENVKVVKLGMRANPWNCFCLDKIFDWLYRNNGSTVDSVCDSVDFPVCAYPDTNAKNCTETSDENVASIYFKELHKSFDFLFCWKYPTVF